mgnify:CR=1 FL=1
MLHPNVFANRIGIQNFDLPWFFLQTFHHIFCECVHNNIVERIEKEEHACIGRNHIIIGVFAIYLNKAEM